MGWGAKRVGRGEARVRKGGGKGGVESEWTGLHANFQCPHRCLIVMLYNYHSLKRQEGFMPKHLSSTFGKVYSLEVTFPS